MVYNSFRIFLLIHFILCHALSLDNPAKSPYSQGLQLPITFLIVKKQEMRYTNKCISFICGCSSVVEYRLPKPWVTSSNLAIRSISSTSSLSRELFCCAIGCEIRRLRSYLTPLCYARNRCPTSSACRFAPADLVLHVSPSAPLVLLAPYQGSFFVALSVARFEGRKSTHLIGKCFAGFHLIFQFFYDFTQYFNLVLLIGQRQINPLLVN